jgi:hypothetical protein
VIVAQGSEATADGCSIDVDNRRRTNKPHNFAFGQQPKSDDRGDCEMLVRVSVSGI